MKNVTLFLALITSLFTLNVAAQRSRNNETPVYLTKDFQSEKKLMENAGVSKWLAWGNGIYEDEVKMIERQDTTVEVLGAKEFSGAVLPIGKDIVMLKADAFNLAYMTSGNFYHPDKVLVKDRPNLFLFRHGFYAAVYDDVKEAYYFYYYPHPLTKTDPIIRKGYRVFWINWSAITKEVKPIDTVAIANAKHTVTLSGDENAKYIQALNAAAATIEAKYQGRYVTTCGHGHVYNLVVEKEGHSDLGEHIATMEFQINPDPSRLNDGVSQDITFVYDHTTNKGTILWLTLHGNVKYHSELETKDKLDQLITSLDTFL